MHVDVMMTVTRHAYLEHTLTSWAACRQRETIRAFRFLIEPTPDQQKCADTIKSWAMIFDIPHQIVLNETILGVALNPWTGFQTSFDGGADYVIYAEDDTVVANSYLEYHWWAAQTFIDDLNIAAVCGFRNNDADMPEDELLLAYHDSSFSPIGWGTWFDRWHDWIGPTWDKDYSTYNGKPGHEAGWDWNLNTREIPRRGLTNIWPYQSQTDHRGVFGVHYQPSYMLSGLGVAKDFKPHQEGRWATSFVPPAATLDQDIIKSL